MGVKEINLIAQDTTSYGSDLNNGKPMLAELLKPRKSGRYRVVPFIVLIS